MTATRSPSTRPARSARALALIGVLMLSLAGCTATDTSEELTDEDYVANFRTVAFYREFDPEKRSRELTRWETPLRVALIGDVSERYTAYARDQLEDMAAISGLPVDLVAPDQANVVVIFSPEPFDQALTTYREFYRPFFNSDMSMERITTKMKPEATCFGHLITDDERPNDIVGAVILIPTDLGRFVVRACIIEELTQAMGLFNDSDDIKPSIFNDSSSNMTLTDHDRILFRLLYDKRLHPGMTWEEAEPIVRRAVAELRGA
jgi:Protein of unknown function (DUF2927)